MTHHHPRLDCTLHEPRNGQASRHTFVLSHALGCDRTMWDGLVERLSADSSVLTYDQFGHGLSDTPPGPYTMARLADEAAALIKERGLGPVIWIGLSMGGMVGQELALRHPDVVRALVLANTTSHYPFDARQGWDQRIATLRTQGLEAIVDTAMTRWFHDRFRAEQPQAVAHWRAKVLTARAEGYAACCEAIRDVDTFERLQRIQAPTLVIAGELDQGTPPVMARAIASQVPHAQLVVLLQASHLSVLEQPADFAHAVERWVLDIEASLPQLAAAA